MSSYELLKVIEMAKTKLIELAKKLNVFQNKERDYMAYDDAIRLLNQSQVWKQISEQQ